MEELKGFKKGNTFIFFSHQWLAWSEPDPEDLQYNAMVSALKELKEAKNLSLSNTYIWLDYTSIPQTHRGLQRLSINSLTNYAGACDYFVIVAPGETNHKDTGILCDKISYQDRTWCRAEQLAHGCRRGVENMYLTADGGGLEPLTWDWIKASFQIFNGRLTCCARGHVGMEQCDQEYLVTPVLGLYCELLADQVRAGAERQGDLVDDRLARLGLPRQRRAGHGALRKEPQAQGVQGQPLRVRQAGARGGRLLQARERQHRLLLPRAGHARGRHLAHQGAHQDDRRLVQVPVARR